MAWSSPQVGIGYVPAYQTAGDPFLSSSQLVGTNPNNGELKVVFPRVCKSVTIVNRADQPLYVHFDTRANANVINKGYYVELTNPGDSWAFNARCKEIYISMKNAVAGPASFALSAELTGISAESMYTLTGSGVNT